MSSFGSRPTGVTVFSLVVAIATMGLSSVASADEPPLVLTNENIGMSGEQIEAAQKPAPAPAPAPAPEPQVQEIPPSEFTEYEPGPATAEEACLPAGADKVAITSFEHCVETAIRGGNGYTVSDKVCRSLFPEAS